MEWAITNFIAAFLLPPLNLLILLGVGLLLLKPHPKAGKTLLITGFGLLWLFSTPFLMESGMRWLESSAKPVNSFDHDDAQAIVVLGGSLYFKAPEYAGRDRVNFVTMERLSYGAKLHRETGLPVLVTGGAVNDHLPEGELMRESMQEDFRVPVRWVEAKAINTFENARFSAEILKRDGVSRIYLVTHAWHMRRSAEAFRKAGFEVIAAPMGFTTRYQIDAFAFLPSVGALRQAYILSHELIGLLWYKIRTLAS